MKWPCRRSCALTMCSNVDSQCVSNTITVSGSQPVKALGLDPVQPRHERDLLPLVRSRSRTSSGNTIVGTCATSAAPTTSPIAHPSSFVHGAVVTFFTSA